MKLTPEQHHEDCDHRVADACGDDADCNLDCEATAMQLPHVSREELFMLIVGLERLRDDNAAEAKRYDAIDTDVAKEYAAECRAESVQAENLRERLKDTPNYRPEDIER